MIRFCSKLGCMAALAAAGLHAADANSPVMAAQSIKIHPDARTGRLVRSVVVSPRTVAEQHVVATNVVAPHIVVACLPAPPASAKRFSTMGIDQAVEQIAAEQSLPAELIHSVIKVESNYNPNAVSPAGAQGLMQLIPSTARRFGVANVFNPVENIQGGAKYLKYLMDLYNGDTALALAAYNAGEGAVAKYGNVPPYRETQNYLQSVAVQLKKANQAAKPKNEASKPAEAAPSGEKHIEQIVQPDGTVRYVAR